MASLRRDIPKMLAVTALLLLHGCGIELPFCSCLAVAMTIVMSQVLSLYSAVVASAVHWGAKECGGDAAYSVDEHAAVVLDVVWTTSSAWARVTSSLARTVRQMRAFQAVATLIALLVLVRVLRLAGHLESPWKIFAVAFPLGGVTRLALACDGGDEAQRGPRSADQRVHDDCHGVASCGSDFDDPYTEGFWADFPSAKFASEDMNAGVLLPTDLPDPFAKR
mmetsp:Transcript_13677/g.36857  ORF Transcript_13677/g.36857 Transcript_13677/m.36857 type:complete len:222 (+) Transcript_13677:58-723(+)|eukprot:CAMPEP_0117572408 /NCGR_PEP_ID=MMETSP0784-20121206/60336_1 /TAXON_ID=39447 /ORGANISM="" /LENGTH=221 /DNA_ID=CAMNT_0005370767 /DNA_START=39 /DNA_END=704 /DNA_ORIENTATION=-